MLTEVQLYTIAVVATVLVYILNLWSKKASKPIHRGWLTAAVYLISGLLAFAFNAPAFPPFPVITDAAQAAPAILQWASDLLVLIGPIVAFATLIYNALLSRVMDGLTDKVAAALQPKRSG